MKRLTVALAAMLVLGLLATPAFASGFTTWFQGFEQDTDGWNTLAGVYGSVDRVASGTGGIPSATGNWHAVMDQGSDSAPYSFFDGPRSEWPGRWVASADVYLDTDWATGTGFDYSVAAYNTAGGHRRDFIVHVSRTAGGLMVSGSNNSNFAPRVVAANAAAVPATGWYTIQHVFRDNGGVLAVDLRLLDDAGTEVWTTTRTDATDTIGNGGIVGGNGYSWFTHITGGAIAVDNHRLVLEEVLADKDQCKDGGWADWGFKNQGQCIKFVNTGKDSR